MRWALASLLAAGALALSFLVVGWNELPLAPLTAAEDAPWQVRELVFLKGAYDRVRADMGRETEGSVSLREEQTRIVRQMTEIAKLMPTDAIPVEYRMLVGTGVASETTASVLTRLVEKTAADMPEPDLRVGLGRGVRPMPSVAELATDPELREPIAPPLTAKQSPRGKARAEAGDAP